jgi:hypothetical protein
MLIKTRLKRGFPNDIESPIFNFSIIASRGLIYCPDELVALNFESRVLALHDEAVFVRERERERLMSTKARAIIVAKLARS